MTEHTQQNSSRSTLRSKFKDAVYYGRSFGIAGALTFGVAASTMSGIAAYTGNGELVNDYYDNFLDDDFEFNADNSAIETQNAHIVISKERGDDAKWEIYTVAQTQGAHLSMTYVQDHDTALQLMQNVRGDLNKDGTTIYSPQFVSTTYQTDGAIERVIPKKGEAFEDGTPFQEFAQTHTNALLSNAISDLSGPNGGAKYGLDQETIQAAANNTPPQRAWGNELESHAQTIAAITIGSFLMLGGTGFALGGTSVLSRQRERPNAKQNTPAPK